MLRLPLRPAAALLSRRALKTNVQILNQCIRDRAILHNRDSEIMAMVKADAYGHDLKLIMPELRKLGVRHFAVASVEEGLIARSISASAHLVVLGGTLTWSDDKVAVLKQNKFSVAVNDLKSLKFLSRLHHIPIHLKLDTGMNRLGLKPNEWGEALDLLRKADRKLEGLFTHYASSGDEIFHSQARVFEEAVRWFWAEGFRPKYIHSENSAALLNKNSIKRGILSEVGNLIRPGISLYGYYPRKVKGSLGLTPVLELVSEVGLVKKTQAGEGISYGHLYKADHKHDYGIVTLGYADGLSKAYTGVLRPQLRSRNGQFKAWLDICGAICMDMVMVRASKAKLERQDSVAFWGRFPNQVLEAGLVEPYELNLRISKRIPRIWTA